MIKTACEQFVGWSRSYSSFQNLTLSINISGKQITHPAFYSRVIKIIEQTGVNPSRINFEITENSIIEDTSVILEMIKLLSQLGINLQLDDFGTGQSSIGYLQRFPLDAIKIDRAFIKKLDQKREQGLVKGIIQLAQALELKIIAERRDVK